MRFNVLGPLEVVGANSVLPLGGFNQRATLGALLLRANTVVATSHLVKALWDEDPPVTARKMLQNAVSGLRSILGDHGGGEAVLLTYAPGYLLQVDVEDVDVLRFHSLVERGRSASTAGHWEPAVDAFRDALALWRGPALADLLEGGVDWSDLTVLENARLSAFEDYVDAQLAMGQHSAVVSELERIVADAELPRERMCRQLMLALYRSGRQADALSVYRRNRTVLAERLGLDPGRELQNLERAILSHDPALAAPAFPQATEVLAGGAPGSPRPAMVEPPAGPADPISVTNDTTDGPDAAPPAVAERKTISILQVRVKLAATDDDPEAVDEKLEALTLAFRDEAERFGGVVQGLWAVGSGWVALFGAPRTRENDAERAVRAAVAIRDRLELYGGPDAEGRPAVLASLAVTTGVALLTSRSRADLSAVEVTGGILDESRKLVDLARPGEISVCPVTRKATERILRYRRVGTGAIIVDTAEARTADLDAIPFLERHREIAALRNLLGDVCQRRRPHLVTLLGEPGIGKSRLAEELRQHAGRGPGAPRWLVGRAPAFGLDVTTTVMAGIVRSFAGIASTDSDVLARRRLSDAVYNLLKGSETAEQMVAHLGPLLGLAGPEPVGVAGPSSPGDDTFAAWRRLIEEIAITEPVVIVIEDLHLADDRFLDFIEHFVDRTARVPLLVLAIARPEMLLRRPYWSGGKRNAFILTLEPLSDAATSKLLGALAMRYGLCAGKGTDGVQSRDEAEAGAALSARIAGNPLFAVEYFRMHQEMAERARSRGGHGPGHDTDLDGDVLSLPQTVRSIIAARLDTLPQTEKQVLLDAAVLGEALWPSAVAAVGARPVAEVTRCLEYLERRDFLHRVGERTAEGEPVSAFRQLIVREVAYAQMPRLVRAERHLRAARWAESSEAHHHPDVPEHHYRQATNLTTAAGNSAVPLLTPPRMVRDIRPRYPVGAAEASLN